MLSEKSQAIVLERDQGAKVDEIAERYEVSHQRVSAIVTNATALVNSIEMQLLVARKTGEVCAYLIPDSEHSPVAMAFVDWLVRRLRARDLELEVSTRRASNGVAVLIEDISDYRGGAR
jgi:hypothetical protein